jgi:hypothetical protein
MKNPQKIAPRKNYVKGLKLLLMRVVKKLRGCPCSSLPVLLPGILHNTRLQT